jgi:hypothetical protein
MLQRSPRAQSGLFSGSQQAPILLTGLGILLLQLGLLHLVGRPLACPCGSLRLWQGGLDPVQNSQQVADAYSLLHGIFGLALFLWLERIRPHWPLAQRALVAMASSAIWEVMENLPPVVRRFGAEGSDLHYVGDSLINSAGDTLFVLLGFLVAARLPLRATLLLAVLVEAVVYLMIGDGIVVGTFRFIFG